eukprot:scaffold7514_cov67-Cylindrotheca_fusiformis.AAC.2
MGKCFVVVLPHGCYSLFVATVCTIAWIASLLQDGCDFAKVSGPVVAELTTTGQIPPPWLEFGIGAYRVPSTTTTNAADNETQQQQHRIWYTDMEQKCQYFEEEELETFMDTAWTTARTFAFLALVIGGGGTVFLWASTIFVFSKATWRWTGYLMFLGSLCNSLTFLWFLTAVCSWNTCSILWGSKADIVASSLWFLGGLLLICKYPIPKNNNNNNSRNASSNNNNSKASYIPTASVVAIEEEDEEGDDINDDKKEDEADGIMMMENQQERRGTNFSTQARLV